MIHFSTKLSIKLSIVVLILLALGCKEEPTSELKDEIVIRLSSEPTSLSPILSKSSFETEVHEYLFISLADYNPKTMELIPVILEELPVKKEITEGSRQGSNAYKMQIKADATWANGSPITAHDVINTFKLVFHPDIVAPSWEGLLQDIDAIELDSEDPKRFTMYMQGNYFLQMEGILTAEIYPKHIYDANGILDNYTLAELKSENFGDTPKAQEENFKSLGKEFSSTKFTQQILEGAGPYQLEKWETGQYISLKQKENYWGDNYPNNPFLNSFSNRLIYRIVPDATVALTLLKNDEIDFLDMYRIPFASYDDLRSNEEDDDIAVHQYSLPRSYLIYINHEDERLRDKNVRLALNKCLNVERIINQIEGGLATPINSLVPQGRLEYNTNLGQIGYDIEQANTLLESAGWTDQDGDGIREKTIDGRKEKLSFRFFNTGSNLGENIANILIDEASKIGIEVINTVKPYSTASKENLYTGDYELFAGASTASESRQDLYIQWHSASIGSGGRNYSRYDNAEADTQMELIRSSQGQAQVKAYHKLQEIMLEDAALIYLYTPMGRVATDDDILPLLSSKSPGYFANAFAEK